MDLFIFAVSSPVIYLGKSILRALNGIKFQTLTVSILYTILLIFDLN